MEQIELRIEHLHRSLVNAQETIRFLDSKSAAVTSLSLLLLGGALSAMHFFISASPPYFKLGHSFAFDCNVFAAGFLLISFVFFAVCLFHSMATLLPRPPGPALPTLLFPYYVRRDVYHHAKDNFTIVKSEEAILSEYYIQLEVLGGIMAKKMPSCSKAIKAFRWQIWATVAFAITGLFLVGSSTGGAEKGIEFSVQYKW
jgi:hypothetical protein